MAILARFQKQPNEVLDYDVDYSEWFAPRTDSPSTAEVVVEPGIIFKSASRVGNIGQVTLGGGEDEIDYKITVRLTTTNGLIREADFLIQVRET